MQIFSKPIAILLTVFIVTSCSQQPLSNTLSLLNTESAADIIFLGKHILTVDTANQGATAVAVRDNVIVGVGKQQDILTFKGPNTRIVELGEQALIPGFIDTHGHLSATVRFIDFENLSAPPVGKVNNIGDLVKTLQQRLQDNPPNKKTWLVGYGYDDSLLAESRHPTRDDLDKVSKDTPIFILHVSGHLGVINSAALAQSGLNADTPDPTGGVIRRRAGTQEPNGVLEESAMSAVLGTSLSNSMAGSFDEMFAETIQYYASHGITTIQDGAASPADIKLFSDMSAVETFPIDITSFRFFKPEQTTAIDVFDYQEKYTNGYRVAGVKFSLDGSPQGRTAWLTEPYHEGPEGADEDYVAYSTVNADQFISAATRLIRKEIPLIVHTNGDAAIDLLNQAVSTAMADNIQRDHRTVAIHAQLMREDQLDQAAKLKIVPSFFSAHTFFWGDWHLKSFGQERGNNISPTRWATDRGVTFTLHNDTPIVPPDMLRLIWATVNRETRSGKTIGPEQRLTPAEALAAVTRDAAYQYFEEDTKGTITVGKQADLVVLSANPTTVQTTMIKDIQVLETFSRGTSVYQQRNPE